MTKEDFEEKKSAALAKVLPHYLDPTRFGPAPCSSDEIAALLASGPEDMPSRAKLARIERSACQKMQAGFAKLGLKSAADMGY